MSDTITSLLCNRSIVAIVRLDDLSQAEPLTRALLDGGIRAIEFTLTNMAALQVVQQLRKSVPQFENGEAAVGLGSVRSLDEAEQAIDAGAQFLVSPFLDLRVVAASVARQIPIAPGAFTPTEIATAWQAGASLVKVFPARTLGPDYIRDVLAPMPYLRLMPTGGVDLTNIASYFQAGAQAVGVGSSLVKPAAVAQGNWSAIAHAASQYTQAINS